jgi:large exoprotein involved in heme utilization and adhesion
VQDGAEISAFTSGTGTPGKIEVNSGESIALSNGLISTAVNPGAVISRGEGKESGNISLQTRRLSLMDSAQISASTSGEGDAGNIRIQATDATSLTNSGISTAVNPGAIGRGGNIDIQTGVFSLADNAQVTASTAGQGNAGSVRVTATTFESSGGGQIRTSTAGGSNAGSINLYILDSVTLTGNRSGLFASTDRGSSGNGGSIFIDPRIVTVRDGARIAVDSQGSGTGGSIDLQAGRLVLDRGEISAQTASNQGGNINLQLSDLLLLRRNSQISTTAGTAQTGGDGGNIRIMAPFIIALRTENNDITANAFTGRGGRVDITTQGLFGIEPRDRLTPLSDITASSEFGIAGVVTINTPDVDPSRGLTELPSNLVDAASQIAQGCVPDTRQSTSSFVVTGRGGLPPSPTEPLGNDAVMTAWVTVDGKQEVGNRGQGTGDRGQGIEDRGQGIEDRGQRTEDKGQRRQRRTGNRGQGAGAGTPDPRYPVVNPPSSPSAIIEAQSWIVDANGQIVLVAPSSTRNSHSWLVNGACRTHPGD